MGSLQAFTHLFTTDAQVIYSFKFLVHPVSLETSQYQHLVTLSRLFLGDLCHLSMPSRLWMQSVSPAGWLSPWGSCFLSPQQFFLRLDIGLAEPRFRSWVSRSLWHDGSTYFWGPEIFSELRPESSSHSQPPRVVVRISCWKQSVSRIVGIFLE